MKPRLPMNTYFQLAYAITLILVGFTMITTAHAQAAKSCWIGNFNFDKGTTLRWCVDPATSSTDSMKVIVQGGGPNGTPFSVAISDHDDDHKQDIAHEIRYRVTLTFARVPYPPNQLPIRVTARYNIQRAGDTIFEWDEWNDFKCPNRSLEVNLNSCWFHQTGWKSMKKAP